MEWQLQINHNGKPVQLKAEVIYKSSQIIRIRVHGNNSLLLECDYPGIRLTNAKKGVHWKIREGANKLTSDGAKTMLEIFTKLEFLLKKDFKLLYPETFF